VNLDDIRCEGVYWVKLAPNRVQWQDLVALAVILQTAK
jgi:hypothetical protein